MLNCAECGAALTKNKKFCSKQCGDRNGYLRRRKEYACIECNGVCFSENTLCNRCNKIKHIAGFIGLAGDRNQAWTGGSEQWSPGRYGKDSNGLSWKVQRRLAWNRDKYHCTKCDKFNPVRRPDVHHIVPWRISQSHDLSNLTSLCKKCHKIEDEKAKKCYKHHAPLV